MHSYLILHIFSATLSHTMSLFLYRYLMVFVPFTGIDNHKKSTTFAAALLAKEDTASYVWLFTHFKAAMGFEPVILLTDQDSAVKAAFAQVFTTCRHRFCMWHIMSKVSEKVGPYLNSNEDFSKRLNDVVWNDELDVDSFETGWHSVMSDFGLLEVDWFVTMFDLCEFWIPAYFRIDYE